MDHVLKTTDNTRYVEQTSLPIAGCFFCRCGSPLLLLPLPFGVPAHLLLSQGHRFADPLAHSPSVSLILYRTLPAPHLPCCCPSITLVIFSLVFGFSFLYLNMYGICPVWLYSFLASLIHTDGCKDLLLSDNVKNHIFLELSSCFHQSSLFSYISDLPRWCSTSSSSTI